jgi:uncharacterized damage-inducible protein DinB
MHTPEALLDLNQRTHRNLGALLAHCRGLSGAELTRELPGFGYPTVRLQLNHMIGAQKYWIGVIEGRIDVDDDEACLTLEALEAYREEAQALVERYLRGASVEELNTPRSMMTWRRQERVLIPAQIVLRTVTHIYHHTGQVVAMCRLLGKPVEELSYPIT